MSIARKEFKGNIAVSVSDNEVRIWCCDDQGKNIFRFKAVGEVHKLEDTTYRADMFVVGTTMHLVHNPREDLPTPVKCVVCGKDLDGLYCTNNVCQDCCIDGKCPSVAWCKAVQDGHVKIREQLQ